MKQPNQATLARQKAFTLIELLVVIAIIGVLAAMIFPITAAIKTKQIKSVAGTQLIQLETAIEAYKTKVGYYPPDNPQFPATNVLYYELEGTVYNPNTSTYTTLDGSESMNASQLNTIFGARLTGFANSSTSATGTDDQAAPENFLKGAELKPNQSGHLDVSGVPLRVLTSSIRWPSSPPNTIGPTDLTVFQYVSSHPVHNPNSYDLWVDVAIHGKTNRISNWTSEAQILP